MVLVHSTSWPHMHHRVVPLCDGGSFLQAMGHHVELGVRVQQVADKTASFERACLLLSRRGSVLVSKERSWLRGISRSGNPAFLQPARNPALSHPRVASVALRLCVAKCSCRATPRVIPALWVALVRQRCHNPSRVVATRVVTISFLRCALRTRVSSAFGVGFAICHGYNALRTCVVNLGCEPAL